MTFTADSGAIHQEARVTLTVIPPCGSIISYGQTLSASLSTSDPQSRNRAGRYADCYTFSGNAGDNIVISMDSSAFDTYLYLSNAAGQVIAFDDDGGGGRNSRIPAGSGFYTLPGSGTYAIEATSFHSGATGNYSLTLRRNQ